ncbi:hypothetical protein DYD21_07450 [Rhodohalobacter sp. SW132]|uniref:PP2C family protein-serine/threonine phosphatase n=1 Tax=Rhodohalobacter sp. SW132 TaxID=2293433 RepID=UPI000E23CD8F|nr:PP2C family protein-serine/threonine phosphatase [Rhodohalobacter sp. SW132]REL37614.1 hypothetical protein DYD21_07450 [Rhodohalobacter sp. SW132]
MLETDTAKRDITLVVIGLLAAGFFYWFYGSVHPLGTADGSLGEDTAQSISSQELTRLGYATASDALTTFRTNNSVLEARQRNPADDSIIVRLQDRQSYFVAPAFYWHSQQVLTADERSRALMGGDAVDSTVEVVLSESGEFIALYNSEAIFPSRVMELPFLEEIFPEHAGQLQSYRTDSNIFDQFHFQINSSRNGLGTSENQFVLSREDVIRLAEYHLDETVWPLDYFSLSDIESIVYHGVDLARVEYTGGDSDQIVLAMEMLPTGALLSLSYNFTTDENESAISDIRIGTVTTVALLFAIWVLVLLFVRIRLRLIDTKLAVLIAVLAGFLLPLVGLLEWIYSIFFTFDEFTLQTIFWDLFQFGFLASLGSLFFFTTTAVGDSITRDNWLEKLRTFDLIRLGKVYNRPVGLMVIRGVAWSYIMIILFGFIFYMMPDGYLNVSEQFRSDRTILPSVSVLIINLLLFLFITQALLLILVGKLRAFTKKGIWIVLLVGTVSAVIGFLPVNIGPWYVDMTVGGLVGLAIGWIYLKEDYLTILLALILLGMHLMSASGWVMATSPDSSVFYVSLLFTVILIGIGAYGLYRGQPIDQLPEYVPDYINDLKKDERVKQELQIARKVQQSFLPETMPVGNGMEFAAICKPAYETGGDYYDFIGIDDDKHAITIGDVSGKGIEAAFYMTFTKGVLHALCSSSGSTVDILAKINELFLKNARKGTFISLIFGVIDTTRNTFRFSRGGHNPILHFSAEEGVLKEHRPPGIGLGMAPDGIFRKNMQETEISLKSGDLIVLFTDGVVEATNARGKFYGDKRLHGVIKRHSRRSAEEILNAIAADLYKFAEGSDPHDDMTAIVIKKQ